MVGMKPNRLFVMDWALRDDRNVQRLQRMAAALGRSPADVTVLRADQLPQMIRDANWMGEVRQGAYTERQDPDLLFTAFTWSSDQERADVSRSPLYRDCIAAYRAYGDCKQWFTGGRTLAMLGHAPFFHYEARPEWAAAHVCWSLYDLHSAWGCVHRCAYCQRGSVYVINLNVEEFCDRVDMLVDTKASWQKTFRYDVEQDVMPLEPEYGACAELVRRFARREDRYLILFTKSANVDHLLSLPHGGRTILLWTLSTRNVSRRFEAGTGTMEERLEAARRCQQAGYPVRFKLKPIIPTRNWREEITDMLTEMYARVQPENLSMELVFFDSVAEMDSTLGLENLDAAFVKAAQEAEVANRDSWPSHLHGPRPFPFEVKEQVYRHVLAESRRLSPATPVTLCAETQRMWQALDPLVDGKPWDYVCNCGPHCTPGLRTIPDVQGPDAPRIQRAIAAQSIPGASGS